MNKQGLTLVELIAVIVILGLIVLLVTPVVTDLLDAQKEKAFNNSVEGIVKTIKSDISDSEFSGIMKFEYEDGILKQVDPSPERDIDTKGETKGIGTFFVKSGDFKYIMHNDEFCVVKKDYESREAQYFPSDSSDCEL